MIFKFTVSGLKGSVVYADFMQNVEVEIEAEKINQATDALRKFFTDNYLQADKMMLHHIELNRIK